MNEAPRSDSDGDLFIGADTSKVSSYIEVAYVDAWRKCAPLVPKSWLVNKIIPDSGLVYDRSTGTGYLPLPKDYYMLTSFKLKKWRRPVIHADDEGSDIAKLQYNRYTMGSFIRPVCITETRQIDGKTVNVLAFYSLPLGTEKAEVENAIYVPIVKTIAEDDYNYTDDEEDIKIDDRLLEPLAYMNASLVYGLFEKSDISKLLEQKSIEMINQNI
jgi:hypothetical protein